MCPFLVFVLFVVVAYLILLFFDGGILYILIMFGSAVPTITVWVFGHVSVVTYWSLRTARGTETSWMVLVLLFRDGAAFRFHAFQSTNTKR